MDIFKPVKPNEEKIVISLRILADTLEKIDKKAETVDISRNELINQMIMFALSKMDSEVE